jgi:hypothetical protein
VFTIRAARNPGGIFLAAVTDFTVAVDQAPAFSKVINLNRIERGIGSRAPHRCGVVRHAKTKQSSAIFNRFSHCEASLDTGFMADHFAGDEFPDLIGRKPEKRPFARRDER